MFSGLRVSALAWVLKVVLVLAPAFVSGVWLPIHGDGDRLHGAVQVQRGEPKNAGFGSGSQALKV